MAMKPVVKRSVQKQSFFKILLGDFSKRLRIPPNFIQNFNERLLGKCALGGLNGKWWDVELEKRKNGLFLHNGWQHFVKEHHLEDGDLLIFRFDGESRFKVKIYGKTTCEKVAEAAETRSGSPVCSGIDENTRGKTRSVDLGNKVYNVNCEKKTSNSGRSGNHVTSRKRPEDDHAAVTSNGSILFKSKNLCFLVTFMRYYQYRMGIPKKLAIALDLMSKNCITVQDPTGRSWHITLNVRWTRYYGVEMTTGLAECWKENQIVPGDTLIFEFVKESVHVVINVSAV